MSAPHSKPRVIRPSTLPRAEVVDKGVRVGAGRFAIGRKGLLGSLFVHGCLIAAACTITLVEFGGDGAGGGSSASEGVDFQMSAVSPSHSSDVVASRPKTLPILAVKNPDRDILIPDAAEFPQMDPVFDRTTNVQDSLATSLEPDLGGSLGFSEPLGKGPVTGNGKREGKTKGVGNGRSPGGKARTSPPKLVSSPAPRYPTSARKSGTSGKVAVLIRVRGDGTAASARVYRGSGHTELDQAAVNAAQSWTFSKSPSLGQSETVDVVVQVNFSL